MVTKLDKDPDGSVHTVNYVTYGGVRASVTAEVVILAAHAIELSDSCLSGLANKSDQVGEI